MKLPEHWTAELPEAVHAHTAFATCDVTYKLEKSTLHAERRLVILQSKVPASSWKAYKAWYESCGAGSVPYIQLTHAFVSGPDGAAPPATVSNAEAAKLIDDANNAIREHAVVRAKELLDQAKALNPQQRNLWGTYGYRAYELGITTEAIEDYRKELQYHPDQTWVYGPLAQELYRTDRKPEAVAALRKAVVAAPDNANLQTLLVAYLADEGDNAGAIAAGNAALKILPASDTANSALALATATPMVATKDFAHAADLLINVIKNAETPLQKNNTAYLLAETGLHLDEAEATERAALDELAAETNSWTLDEAPAKLKQTSSLVSACWDTFGYILFREGHLPEARNYIEAAWHNRQSAEVGLHLGDVLLALHDPSAALATYELAQTTLPGSTSFRNGKMSVTVSPQSKPIGDKLDAGMAQARAAGARSQIKDPRVELQKIRVHPLGPAGSHSGSVEYRILVAQDKVEVARPVSTDKITGADSLLKAATISGLIPSASATQTTPNPQPKIALFGYVNCLSNTCEFVAEP